MNLTSTILLSRGERITPTFCRQQWAEAGPKTRAQLLSVYFCPNTLCISAVRTLFA